MNNEKYDSFRLRPPQRRACRLRTKYKAGNEAFERRKKKKTMHRRGNNMQMSYDAPYMNPNLLPKINAKQDYGKRAGAERLKRTPLYKKRIGLNPFARRPGRCKKQKKNKKMHYRKRYSALLILT